MYRATGFDKYLEMAEEAAWYLSTWQWHQTVRYPADTVLGKMGYDTSEERRFPPPTITWIPLRSVMCRICLSFLNGPAGRNGSREPLPYGETGFRGFQTGQCSCCRQGPGRLEAVMKVFFIHGGEITKRTVRMAAGAVFSV